MKNFILKNKITILLISIIIILCISLFATCFGMDNFETIDYAYGIVNTDYLNMRSGSGINFESISLLTRNEYVRIFAKIGKWYIIQNEENQIGTVHSDYIIPTNELKSASTNTEVIKDENNITDLTQDENELLSLINDERKKNNLSALKIDKDLQNVARLKANDLVENNYFSHISPIYGTPFEMLKQNKISYKTASENIAGNSSISAAFKSWMNSESHKNNILSNEYNYTGLAIENSIAYGKIIVEFFIGR